ncbi:MAG: MmgE/PrpD family protein [Proteobacteria bacterium]|nr:MmgE/PrpD family protein [Pseudomonadota bacterium]
MARPARAASRHAAAAKLTTMLAEFISGFRPRSLSPAVRAMTETVVFDGSGALLAAANPAYSTGRLIAAFVQDQGGRGESSVVGHGFRSSAAMAALANGTMGYACDVEPHHPEGILHPIAVMIPTALGVGERVGASGAEFLAAVTLGCEIEYRLSIALGPAEQYALGFHPSSVCGCFGATAAAAYLLGLKPDAVVRALGLAACQASGMMAWETDPSENARPFQMGVAARNGVTAALLAKSGFGGPTAVFDHGHTVFRAFSRNPQPGRLVEGLGSRFDGIMELAIKPYACVSFLHPALDALIGLLSEHALEAEDIERITLRFPKDGIHCIDGNPLKSHCAQYILPVAVVDREIGVADIFIDRRITDRRVAALAKRVEVTSDPELDRLFPDSYASIVEVRTRAGKTLSRRNDIARGYPETPLGAAALEEKFDRLVGSVAAPARRDRLKAALRQLPKVPDLKAYADALRAPVNSSKTIGKRR